MTKRIAAISYNERRNGRWEALLALFQGLLLLKLVSANEADAGLCSSMDADWRKIDWYLYAPAEHGGLADKADGEGRRCERGACREHFKLVSYMTENIYEYGSYASACILWYARLRDYSMFFYNFERIQELTSSAALDGSSHHPHRVPQLGNVLPLDGDQRWQKVWLLHETIRNSIAYGKSVDDVAEYVVWVDSDVIVLDPNLRLERFCRSFPHSDIIVSRDFKAEHGLINSGMMILRVSEWTLRFLESWWSFDHDDLSDQGAFGRMWAIDHLSLKRHTTLLDPEVLNTRFPAWFNLMPDHKVLHLAGVHDEIRVAVFQEALRRICSFKGNDIEEVRQLLDREDILALLGKTRNGIMSKTFTEAIERLEDNEEAVDEFRKGLQKSLQMGFAGREKQQEAESSEFVGAAGHDTKSENSDEEVEVATIALAWASHQLDPVQFHPQADDSDCHSSSSLRDCIFEQIKIGQSFLDSQFELLDHLRFIPTHLRESAIASSAHQNEPSSDLLGLARKLVGTTAGYTNLEKYSSLMLSSLEACRTQLSKLHRRLLEVKPLLPASVLDVSLRRLLYYSYKLFDLRASIIGEWDWSTRVYKESLIMAIEILCALGHSHVSRGSRTELVDVSLSALFGLSDDAKEEAAAIILAIISAHDAPSSVESSREVSGEDRYHPHIPPIEILMEDVALTWHLDLKQVKVELESKGANLPAIGYRLLDEVWGGRVRPKHIDTTAKVLAEEMRKRE